MQVAEALKAEVEGDGVLELVTDDSIDELAAVDEDASEDDGLEDEGELEIDDDIDELPNV